MLKLSLMASSGFNTEQFLKLSTALTYANDALQSAEFAIRFLSARLQGNNGKCNFDIMHMLLDHDVVVEIAYAGKSTSSAIAYEENGVTHLYDQAFQSIPLLAGNLVHEASHSLGFSHPFLPKRWYYPFGYDNSYVPYAFSSIISDCVKNRIAYNAGKEVAV